MALARARRTCDGGLQINRIIIVVVFAAACRRLMLMNRMVAMLVFVMIVQAGQVYVRRGRMFVANIIAVRVWHCGQSASTVTECDQQCQSAAYHCRQSIRSGIVRQTAVNAVADTR